MQLIKNMFAKTFLLVIAFLYFVWDAVAFVVFHPLARWFNNLNILNPLYERIRNLSPIASMVCFLFPIVMLEPLKPFVVYLFASGQVFFGIFILIAMFAFKVVVIEKVFVLTKPKLLQIGWFKKLYDKAVICIDYVKSTQAWKLFQSVNGSIKEYVMVILPPIKWWIKEAYQEARDRIHVYFRR